MRLHTKTIIIFLNISFILSTSNNAFSNECEAQSYGQINKYIKTCGPSDNIQNMGFAPLKKKEHLISGEWAYEFIKESYSDKTFPLGVKEFSDRIWFYSNIKKDGHNKTPRYIWHLIISPAPKEFQIDEAEAFLVNFNSNNGDVDKLDLLESWDEDLIEKSIIENSSPVIYTNNELTDTFEKSDLNDLWKRLIKNKNMNLIECERVRSVMRSTVNTAYDYTFYLHEIRSEPDNINLDYGYRIASMKTITSPGEVYGFVLNEDGSCLGYKIIIAK